MADLTTIAALKIAIATVLNNSVPDESIEPDDHNALLVDLLDTITGLDKVLRTNNSTGGYNLTISDGDLLKLKSGAFDGDVDTAVLTDNRTYTFQDASGVIAFLSDLNSLGSIDIHSDVDTSTTPPNVDEVLAWNGSNWIPSVVSSGGKVGIPDANGIFTYYSDVKTAIESATSGQTVFLFADCEVTTVINIPTGVNIEGNGFKIFSSQADASRLIISSGVTGYIGRWSNLVLERTNNTDMVVYFINGAGVVQVECSNVIVKTDATARAVYQRNSSPDSYIKGMTIDAISTGIQADGGLLSEIRVKSTGAGGTGMLGTGTAKVQDSYCYTVSGVAYNFPDVISCYGETVSGDVTAAANCYNCTFISSSGSIGSSGSPSYLYNCYGYTNSGIGHAGGTYNSKIISNTNIAYQSFVYFYNELSTFLSNSNIAVNKTAPANSHDFVNCVIESKWNNAGGHGIICGTGSKIKNCSIKVANASANCINGISAYMVNNTYEGATTPISGTQLTTNLTDNQGNILV